MGKKKAERAERTSARSFALSCGYPTNQRATISVTSMASATSTPSPSRRRSIPETAGCRSRVALVTGGGRAQLSRAGRVRACYSPTSASIPRIPPGFGQTRGAQGETWESQRSPGSGAGFTPPSAPSWASHSPGSGTPGAVPAVGDFFSRVRYWAHRVQGRLGLRVGCALFACERGWALEL